MLIKCPECQKEVSDQAEVCIHCGFLLKKLSHSASQNFATERPLSKKVSARRCPKCKAIYPASDSVCPNCGHSGGRVMEEKHYNAPPTNEHPRVTCPTCKSENVVKISMTSKTVSILAWGIFSGKIRKQFKCKDCGYMW